MVYGGCEAKNGHQNDMCWKEIELRAQHLLTILDIIVNIIRWNYATFINTENLHFDNEQEIHMSSENYEESGYRLDLDL